MKKITYKASGVNIAEGNKAVELMKNKVQSTYTNGVVGELGLFSGGFSLKEYMYMKEPTLLASTDGVGTKVLISQMMNKHDTIGQDLVAMCVNDLICQGAKPLFFLDYIATGKVNAEKISTIVSGIADGCKAVNCALIGGETAEMPALYKNEEYDLAGFSVGIVDREKIIDGSQIKIGDAIIGLASSGLHSNGYALARTVLFEKLKLKATDKFGITDKTLGDILLAPTRLYVNTVCDLLDKFYLKGIANITGGGVLENLPRILPQKCSANIDVSTWEYPEIFMALKSTKLIEVEEMFRSFNMGIGMTLIVSKEISDEILTYINNNTEDSAYLIGSIVEGEQKCILNF